MDTTLHAALRTVFGPDARRVRGTSLLAWALAWVDHAIATHGQRRALGSLSDEMLKDIGITRADVARETGRAFWDLPRAG